jgi:uncharacterized protein involved in exopolysaccharide biosynthesis
MGQMAGLASGIGTGIALKNPSDVYVSILSSRTIAHRIIERFGLRAVYGTEFIVDAEKELESNSSISANRDGVITIEVEDRDPRRAANIANGYVEELRELNSSLAISEASQRRLFFENEVKRASAGLISAEMELKRFTQESGLVNPQGQIELSVGAAANLRAQIAAKQIQLAGLRTFATENNPDLKRTLQELSGLQLELAKIESAAGSEKTHVVVPFGKAPEIGLEYLRRFRDVKYQESLLDALAKQYEVARIDEARDATIIQVLDAAMPPERRSRPKRTLIVVAAVLLTALLGFLIALVLDAVSQMKQEARFASVVKELQTVLSIRRRGS